MLSLFTLGRSQIELEGKTVGASKDNRRLLLLAYLAVAGAPVPRTLLGDLLWPESDRDVRRTNLRTLLSRMNGEGYGSYLRATRSKVELNPDAPVRCDVVDLLRLLNRVDQLSVDELRAADSLYRDPLFADLVLSPWPEVAEWAEALQYGLEVGMVRVWLRLIPLLLEEDQVTPAVTAGARLAESAPYEDEAQLLYLQALAANGQMAAARTHLKNYERTMEEEFGDWSPSPALTDFVQRMANPLEAARLAASTAKSPTGSLTGSPETPTAIRHSSERALGLPTRAPALIGRAAESARLESLLDQGARLITVLGMGGAGKTALIRARLPDLRARFADRLAYVDLRNYVTQEEDSVELNDGDPGALLLQAIAAAVNLKLRADKPLFEQLTAALSAAPMCLILDNFEPFHAAALIVAQLADQTPTPTLTIITTSRQALYTKDEALIELGGLRTAEDREGDAAAGEEEWSEAGKLFLHRAAQQWMGFDPATVDGTQVETLCTHLGGHPLAIELAAAQLDFYGLEELLAATRIEVNRLAAGLGDLPGDHDNLARLLTSMWAPLSPQARATLARLSVFAGAFHRTAMQAVAPAPMDVYRELRNASLLEGADEPAWFSLHPLVKQEAAARLAEQADADTVRSAHATHFLTLPALTQGALGEGRRIFFDSALSQLQRQQGDLFAGWRWAVHMQKWDLLADAVNGISTYCYLTGQWQTGIDLLEPIVEQLPNPMIRPRIERRLIGRAAAFRADLLFYCANGDVGTTEALEMAGLAIECLETDQPSRDLVTAYLVYGRCRRFRPRQSDEMKTALHRSVALASEHGWDDLLRQGYALLLFYLPLWGVWAEAKAACAELESISTRAESPDGQAEYAMALVYAITGDWRRAEIHACKAKSIVARRHKPICTIIYCAALNGQNEVDAAAAATADLVPAYLELRPEQAAFCYGLLAICRARQGDIVAATRSAAQAVAQARKIGNSYMLEHARLRQIEVGLITGDVPPGAVAVLQAVLAAGMDADDVTLAFPALYAVARLQASALPPELYLRILKIGAISPAMYYEVRPVAYEYAMAQGIVIADDEYETLWATDLAAVKALVAEVEESMCMA